MHNLNDKPNILCLVNEDFINSLNELKEHLNFNLVLSTDLSNDILHTQYSAMIIDNSMFIDKALLKTINNLKQKGKLLISSSNNMPELLFDDKIEKPFNLLEFNRKVINLVTSKKFSQNSSIKIKNYILDKNEKKFKKDKIFVILTEKEIQLIELLFFEKKSLSKKFILKNIWKYAEDADTHTVETHIYRLRKKILDKFQDENIILNNKNGYSI
jgi:DNA-binding response OmpR family regulator|tara:strand:+ start:155 stop:796 length:642 start_codon:yes stop_codon:yes gene_type:complete